MEKWRGIVDAILVALVLGFGSQVILSLAEIKALHERVKGVESDLITVRAKQGDVRPRLTRVETLVEVLWETWTGSKNTAPRPGPPTGR